MLSVGYHYIRQMYWFIMWQVSTQRKRRPVTAAPTGGNAEGGKGEKKITARPTSATFGLGAYQQEGNTNIML